MKKPTCDQKKTAGEKCKAAEPGARARQAHFIKDKRQIHNSPVFDLGLRLRKSSDNRSGELTQKNGPRAKIRFTSMCSRSPSPDRNQDM